jgi:hypothetical protein
MLDYNMKVKFIGSSLLLIWFYWLLVFCVNYVYDPVLLSLLSLPHILKSSWLAVNQLGGGSRRVGLLFIKIVKIAECLMISSLKPHTKDTCK